MKAKTSRFVRQGAAYVSLRSPRLQGSSWDGSSVFLVLRLLRQHSCTQSWLDDPFAFLFSVLLLRERPSARAITGTFLAFGSVSLVSIRDKISSLSPLIPKAPFLQRVKLNAGHFYRRGGAPCSNVKARWRTRGNHKLLTKATNRSPAVSANNTR